MRNTCRFAVFVTAILALGLSGCGGDDPDAARPDIAAISPEEHMGGSTKQLIFEFRAKVRKHGINAVKQELPVLLENMEGIATSAEGANADTYKQILEKLKAMQSVSSRDAAIKAANEVGTLAAKLPGKAVENPVVE